MKILDSLKEFIYQYYIVPGYDWIDTITYGIILGIAVFGIIPFLKKLKIKIDKRFIIGIIPFIFFGATTRELVDHNLGIYTLIGPYPENFFLVAPFIYITMFILTSIIMIISIVTERLSLKIKYHVPMFIIGSFISMYNIALIVQSIRDMSPFLYVLIISFLWFFVISLSSEIKQLKFLKNENNIYLIMSHIVDASATYVGIDFLGYSEQHVLPNFLINYLGTSLIMFPLKLIVIIPAIYIIDKELRYDELSRRFIKLVIFILGIGPAIRDVTMMLI